MNPTDTPPDGDFSRLIEQQLELAAARLPALHPAEVHPAPEDHEEVAVAHPSLEDVLLGHPEPATAESGTTRAAGCGATPASTDLRRRLHQPAPGGPTRLR